MKYQPTIGLEIHAQLKTKTKMFCGCLNNSEEQQANLNICPVCMGHPGTLPVINKEAIKSVIKTGLALKCKIAENTWFERKNYFYPDLPKGYQISQYESPLCFNGKLNKIRIRRIHLEEDAGRLVHDKGDESLVDYNRAGIPLMELVTEPDIDSAVDARKFCEELRLILRYLGVSDADMENGEMRCEVNISLGTKDKMGTKVEIKNLNSFKVVEKAIDYEIERQTDLLKSGEKIIHETRGWNDNKQETFSQRTKETSEDYRYFPKPDLPSLKISKNDTEKIKAEIPELPANRKIRFKKEYKLPEDNIEIFTNYKTLGDYFEKVISELKTSATQSDKITKLTANYLITELKKYLHNLEDIENLKITPENFAEFITIIEGGKISSSAAQTVLKEMFETGADPSQVIEEKDLTQVSDKNELETIVEKVIKNNPQPVEDYKKGKETALQFLVGQIMRESRGKANPKIAAQILKRVLTN